MSASTLLLLLSVANPGQLDAQVELGPRPHAFELGVAGGAFVSPRAEALTQRPTASAMQDAGIDFLFRLSYSPLRFLGVEAEAGHIAMDVNTASETGMYALRGHVIGQLPMRLSPFVVAGAGVLGLTTKNEEMGGKMGPAFHYGAGLKFFATEDVTARLDARHTVSFADGAAHHLEVLAGVSFTLAAAE